MRFIDKTAAVCVTRDVHYADGIVHANTEPTRRPLLLDVYEPDDAPAGSPRPALVMAFGGAFHRGTKDQDEFDDEGHRNTPVSDYCRAFARRGYAAFSIDYRLVQEDPDPGTTPVILSKHDIPRSRVDHVRRLLGLGPATADMIHAGIEAATDDLSAAFRFVVGNASRFAVDPKRIAVGGFSAGARIALCAAYAEKVPAAAVVSLSGFMSTADLRHWVTDRIGQPPAFLVSGENDLGYVAEQAPVLHDHLEAMRLDHESWRVPGGRHFYPAESHIVRSDGKTSKLETAMAEFLFRTLRLDAV